MALASVAVVYHSRFGHTKVIAEQIAAGVKSAGDVQVDVVSVDELPEPGKDRSLGGKWNVLNQADGIIFGSATYMGDISFELKQFMERSSGIWYGQGWKDKLAAGFTNSGALSGDKQSSLHSIVTFAGQHSMIWVSQGVMPSAYTNDGKNLNRLGAWTGFMSQSDNGGPDVTPPQADKDTAQAFGKRFGIAAMRWVKGRN